MKAEIINIGDEILIGQIVNTNAAWMAEQMSSIGLELTHITVISDQKEAILDAIHQAMERVDLMLLTGGLGPTKDDITKDALCAYFNAPLVFNEEAYAMILDFFASRGFKVSTLNRQQAELPQNCIPVPNHKGTAPGMWFETDGKILISMPGVPFEMKGMMEQYILPRLRQKNGGEYIIHKTVLTHGMGESFLAKRLEYWEDTLPKSIKLAYLPSPGQVRLRLSSRGKDKDILEAELKIALDGLHTRISDLIFGYDMDTMAGVVGQLLHESGQSISTAESCTGGYIAHLITSVPGSSEYFRGSVVSYDNALKISQLDVPVEEIIKYGAVSESVVKAMAEGGRRNMETDWCIASSGVAGPGGGTDEKPVGMIWVALAGPDFIQAQLFRFGNIRENNIHMSAVAGLNLLRKRLIIQYKTEK